MNNDKLYKMAEIVADTTTDLCDKLVDKVCEMHDANRERVAKVIAFVLVKTVLKKYMYNMQMYELKHGEEDLGQKVR